MLFHLLNGNSYGAGQTISMVRVYAPARVQKPSRDFIFMTWVETVAFRLGVPV
jgi:hypothetical protein